MDHHDTVRQVQEIAPGSFSISILDFKPAVESAPDDRFVVLCSRVCGGHRGQAPAFRGVSYYSDATVMIEGLDVPFAIVGPGTLGLSGQPDESVLIENVLTAVRIYTDIATDWLS